MSPSPFTFGMPTLSALAVGCCLATFSAFAAPVLKVDSETHDFGKSYSGAILEHTFTITNTGDEDLLIRQIVFSCGCTSTTTTSEVVAAGGEIAISVTLDTINFFGPIFKTATIHSNAPGDRKLDGDDPEEEIYLTTLTLSADLASPIQVSPVRAVLEVPMGSDVPHSITLSLRNQTAGPITFSDPVLSNPDQFRITIKEAEKEGNHLAIFETIPPYPGGGILTEVSLKTSSPEAPILRFQVTTVEQPILGAGRVGPHGRRRVIAQGAAGCAACPPGHSR